MTRRLIRGCGAAALALAAVVALPPHSADAQVRMTVPPQSEPVALQGATIHTVTNGVIENGTIVFENGVITAVGADIEIPAGARVVNGYERSVNLPVMGAGLHNRVVDVLEARRRFGVAGGGWFGE